MGEAEVSRFLCILIKMGEALQNSGAEVFRVEDTLNRIAAAYGAQEVNVFVITSSIVVTLTMPQLPPQTQTRRLRHASGNDLLMLEELNALSRRICAAPPSVEEFQRQLDAILAKRADGEELEIYAENTVFATGGIGGQYKHSTNFPILTGDGCEIARKHSVELEHMDYVQIHPTCFYTENPGRSFLISESARGEGAIILNHKKERFVDELQPRDVVTKAIQAEMEKEGVKYEFLSFENVPRETILNHFPHIYEHCMKYGFDILMMPIPIVPAQHYFMGGIHVDKYSLTTMPHLYAVGETSCNGVHGKNRLASNSLLESLVFAKRAAKHMIGELV